ncbi:hypothetical protein MBAV_002241 [Candidatus Magnetobacterium bavaricum]|uniref:Uncharacterized protein n=1 Tax=Candidatus Magnetobacterium bavaricum TaxID=29290 RepID=A0A0F3GUC5_9BACT|nr:hypothetical protein MBAV_002241 [Candidatus Magnetobacterium bavaricum]
MIKLRYAVHIKPALYGVNGVGGWSCRGGLRRGRRGWGTPATKRPPSFSWLRVIESTFDGLITELEELR